MFSDLGKNEQELCHGFTSLYKHPWDPDQARALSGQVAPDIGRWEVAVMGPGQLSGVQYAPSGMDCCHWPEGTWLLGERAER